MEETGSACGTLIWKPQQKKPHVRPKYSQKDNTEVDFVTTVINLPVSSKKGCLDQLSDYYRLVKPVFTM
jgi:hypothetical protein